MTGRTVSPNLKSEQMLAQHGNAIRRIAMLMKVRMPWADLDELLQWGAIGMLESISRFDESLGIDFVAFAKKRIKGEMLNGLRREGKLRRGEAAFDIDHVDTSSFVNGTAAADPLSELLNGHDEHALTAALRSLPKVEYQVIAMHFYEDMNNREIAAVLDVSEGYATKIRQRALKTLAQFMSERMDGVPA